MTTRRKTGLFITLAPLALYIFLGLTVNPWILFIILGIILAIAITGFGAYLMIYNKDEPL